MPNLTPISVRKLYSLYENKICTDEEAAQCRGCLEQRVKLAGNRIVTSIGNRVKRDRMTLNVYHNEILKNICFTKST